MTGRNGRNNNNDNIYVDNLDEPLWTMYSSPVIGVFLWLSACFIAQIKSKPQIAQIFKLRNLEYIMEYDIFFDSYSVRFVI